jgi:hypothetical protein
MESGRILKWSPLRLLHLPLCGVGIVGLGIQKLIQSTELRDTSEEILLKLAADVTKNVGKIDQDQGSFWNWFTYNFRSWKGAHFFQQKLSLLVEVCGKPSMDSLPAWWLERQIYEFFEENKLTKLTAEELLTFFNGTISCLSHFLHYYRLTPTS